MSEIYRNSTQFVYLDISGGTADAPPTAVCGDVSLTVNGPETVNGAERWTATIPLPLTQNIGELKVVWDFTMGGLQATKEDYFDVVAPLVELSVLKEEILDLGPVDDNELIRAERKVRSYIEAYTGQVFAPTLETIAVKAQSNNIVLPKRLISFTSSDPVFTLPPVLENDGWQITVPNVYDYDYPGVIVAPYSTQNIYYRQTQKIAITGRWGWERVPAPVQEAALILVEDFLSPDSVYREKYLTSLTSPDWRIQFNSSAFLRTGNTRVDQLLQDYVVRGKWAII